jgi:exodeoxyribonuclease VII large subunit
MTEAAAAEIPATNAPALTVSELSGALKRTIEDRFGFVRVRGEISNYRGPHSSGHAYFCLKDQGARIDAVIWKTTFQRMKVKPEEGLEVIATGKITTFPGKSTYQIVVEAIEPAGLGALMALVEERRRKLAAEGLFAEARKRPIPYLPEVIGVVTSPTGAVIRDILHRIADRFPRHVLVWPVRVQGDTSAAEVARAIEGLNALPAEGALPRPSVIIVARGGGSLEDLWGFNEEMVVRAAATSAIPLISAVGHETDWTLIDHAADLRAPTPTGAAEMCVPVRTELLASLADLARRHMGAELRFLERQRAEWRACVRALPSGEALVAIPRQRLDRAEGRLGAALQAGHDRRRIALARLSHRLAAQSPQARMARAAERLQNLGSRMIRAGHVAQESRARNLDHAGRRLASALAARADLARHRCEAERRRLESVHARMRHAALTALRRRGAEVRKSAQLLGTLSYRNVLARGFALVRDGEGHPLRTAGAAGAGARLDLEFADGHIGATADGAAATPAEPKPRRERPTKANPARSQGTLF